MVWWIAILVFLVSICDDILYVFFIRRVMRGSYLSAAVLSAVLTAMARFGGWWIFAANWQYAMPDTIGSAVGCPLAMYLESKWPKKKPRDKKGQFKPVSVLAKVLRDKE